MTKYINSGIQNDAFIIEYNGIKYEGLVSSLSLTLTSGHARTFTVHMEGEVIIQNSQTNQPSEKKKVKKSKPKKSEKSKKFNLEEVDYDF